MVASPKPGDRFGRLVVLHPCEPPMHIVRPKARRELWLLCECDCKVRKPIAAINLTSGKTKSCGCLRRETQIELNDRWRKQAAMPPEHA